MEIALGVILVLSFPVIAIVALVKAINLRNDLRLLQVRIADLEKRNVTAAPQAAPPIAEQAAPPPPVIVETPAPTEAPIETPVQAEAPEVASAPPPPQPPTPSASPGFEQRFGTQWVVWIGGLALALGAIFLVRYSIEAGLLGPGVRIILAAMFSAALIAAGEWTRRYEIRARFAAAAGPHIPSILTAAGTVAAYATVYAAFALYGFIGAATAFVLLGLVALATLAAALLHGPALAGLGVVGAFVTPLLVSTDEPSYWALYIYLGIVTAAAFALARIRLWRWLAITALVFAVLWTLPGTFHDVTALGEHLFHIIIGFALAAALIVAGLLFGPSAEPGKADGVSSFALAAYLLAAAYVVAASDTDGAALIVFTLLTAATIGIAWRSEAAIWALPAAAILTTFVMVQWGPPLIVETLIMPPGPTAGAIPGPPTGSAAHLAVGALFAALFGLSGFAAQGERQTRTDSASILLIWAGCAVFVPVAMLITLYLRIAQIDRSIPFALIALALAGLFAYATDLITKRAPRPGLAGSAAVFATGAVAALALAFTFALDKGFLTVALALMVPGVAWIAEKRPVPALRYLAAALIVLVLLRIGYEPRIVGTDLGTTPVFNWLLYGYGVPALSFWTAGYLLRKRADDVPARMADSAAILFTVLLLVLEIRHYMTNGDMFRRSPALAEIALQICVGLAMTIGLERLRQRSHSIIHNAGALVIATLTLLAIVFGLIFTVNPMLTGRPVGGAFFNLVLLGYGIPAILAAVLAQTVRASRPLAYRVIAVTVAVALALGYLTLEIRTLYHGPILCCTMATNAEQYTYSAAWLITGILLLIVGLVLRSQPVRMVSAAIVLLTIAKVFLIDMGNLTGIFRALSFIGLGIALVGIGWLYQRLLFAGPRAPVANDMAGPHE